MLSTQESSPPTAKQQYTFKNNKAKKYLLLILAALVILSILYFVVRKAHPSPSERALQTAQNTVFYGYGPDTLLEAVEKSLQNPEWTVKEFSKSLHTVTVKGYCPNLPGILSLDIDVDYSIYDSPKYSSTEIFVTPSTCTLNGSYFPDSPESALHYIYNP